MMMEGMKVQVAKRNSLLKNKELVFMNPVTKLCIQNTGAMVWMLLTPRYNTKRGSPTVFVPQQNECHCGKMCDDQADLAQHVTNDHPANSVWNCDLCTHNSTKRDYIWKYVRTQHHKKHVHICQFKSCKQGTNGRMYGNDEITSVWAHMMKCHGLCNPLGCLLCKNTFSGKVIQRKHIATCQELPQPRRQKEFFCPKEGCGKKYVDQEALDRHVADYEGHNAIMALNMYSI